MIIGILSGYIYLLIASASEEEKEEMGTRSNLYKNPSFTYNKDFHLNSVLQNLKGNQLPTFTSTSKSTYIILFILHYILSNFIWFQLLQLIMLPPGTPVWRNLKQSPPKKKSTNTAVRDQKFLLYRFMKPPSCLTMIIFTKLGLFIIIIY